MARKLEQAFQAQGRFVQDASHELRTPLTGVQAMAEMLETGLPPERALGKDAVRTVRGVGYSVSAPGR